jgi:3-oxoacyl-[acyl-carrier protein] reductase
MRTVLLTHCQSYAGPGAVTVLLREGYRLACHDASFAEAAERARFAAAHPGVTPLAAQESEAIAAECLDVLGVPDAVVSNDIYPITRRPIEEIPMADFDATYAAVVRFPILLTQALLPAMKAQGSGAFVFITSARELRPETGFAVPTTLRAATTAFAKALARETAPFGLQVNVVQPNYLYSELYYPRARFIDDPEGRRHIADTVPAGRLGRPEEIGELIAFLASGKSAFTTGQVIPFTGGWP